MFAQLAARAGNLVRLLFAGGGPALARKVAHAARSGGVRSVLAKARNVWHSSTPRAVPGEPGVDRGDYQEWVRRYDTWSPARAAEAAQLASRLQRRPKFSLLMPTYNSDALWLREAVDAVRAQVYGDWELCIADDASPKPHVRQVLDELRAAEPRIKVHYRPTNGHISAASNDALALATGDWLVLLDHDDLLAPDALLQVAAAIDRNPGARLVYSDEDKLRETGRFDPYFKPDWNPDLFRSQNLFSHLGALETQLVREVGGFRKGLEGSQDYDLVLRCVERVRPEQVVHVPQVLYHWRVHQESTAHSADAKPYAQVAAVRALQEHCERQGLAADVEATRFGYRTIFRLPQPAPMALVLLTGAKGRDARQVQRAVQRIKDRTDYAPLDVRVHSGAALAVEDIAASGTPGIVCLLDIEAEPAHAEWLTELVRQACRPDVGVVAPLISDEAERIVSAGVVFAPRDGGAFQAMDAHAGVPVTAPGHGGRAQLVQRFTAVRDLCIAMRWSVFAQLAAGGPVLAGDGGPQLCARVRQAGLAVLWTPHAAIRIRRAAMAARPLGSSKLDVPYDPGYSPNLFSLQADFTFAWPPITRQKGATS